jgi:hypothetical protein
MTSEFVLSNKCTHSARTSLLAALALVVSGCGEARAPSSGDPGSTPAVATEDANRPIVEIDVDEYVILMDAVVSAGEVTLRLANLGFEEHNIFFVLIESDSTVWETERRLSPGERRSVPLDLEPGAYKAICDFSGHEGRGMFTEFLAEEMNPAEGGAGG